MTDTNDVDLAEPEHNPIISYDDFCKGDLRSGTVVSAERVAKSNKLLQLEVSFGDLGVRTILAGIGKSFTPEDMVNRSVVCILNLPPREMMGIISNGMVLAGQNKEGKLFLVSCNGAPNGAKLG